MPKRVIDADAIAGSDKLEELASRGRVDCVAHYEKLLGLAMANGSFEYRVPDITRRFSKILPCMTADQWSAILVEFQRVKMLFTWRTADGKAWGYWTKIEGRLPAVSQVRLGHYPLGAPVPVRELADFLGKGIEEVRADLEGTAALLGAGDVRRRSGSRHGVDRGKAMARKDKDRIRRGLGGVCGVDARPAAPSPTAPPPRAGRALKKNNEEPEKEFVKKNDEEPERGSVRTGTGVEVNPSLSPRVACDFALFAVRYRACTGRQPGGSPAKRELYGKLCVEFGEPVVLDAVQGWAARRGGPVRLQNNTSAVWDYLEHGQCRAEILGSRGQSNQGTNGARAEERMRKHREVDPKTRELLEKH